MAHRCEAFNTLKQSAAWSGFYEYNTVDQNAIIGCVWSVRAGTSRSRYHHNLSPNVHAPVCRPHPEIENFIFANGFSGHGLQQSPAVGRAISEQVWTTRALASLPPAAANNNNNSKNEPRDACSSGRPLTTSTCVFYCS